MERIKIGYLRKNNIPKETTDLCRLLLSKKRDNYINQIVLYFPKELFNLIIKDCDSIEISLGEYPQKYASIEISKELESTYKDLLFTNESYTILRNNESSKLALTIQENLKEYSYFNEYVKLYYNKHNVYEYKGNKYIRFNKNNNTHWIEIKPITWKIDKDKCSLSSSNSFISGALEEYIEDSRSWAHGIEKLSFLRFSNTKTQKYLDKYLLNDILQTLIIKTKIKYNNFKELIFLLEENNYYKYYLGLVELMFEGPLLNSEEKNTIIKLIDNNTKYQFLVSKMKKN